MSVTRVLRKALLPTLAIAACWTQSASAEAIYGVTDDNKLVYFDSASPGGVTTPLAITGLATNETVKSIDIRPATLQLYALGSTGQLYRIDVVTGAATAVGSGLTITGGDVDIDFNPAVDRLRVVGDDEQNVRVNPNTGALEATDLPLAVGNVTGVAYTNNAPASASFPNVPSTQLFDVDTASDKLRLQDPPNNGVLTDVGGLGVDLVGDVGFDVSTASNSADGSVGTSSAYLVGRTADGNDRLYTVNLSTGAATAVGEIAASTKVKDIAVAAPVPQLAVLVTDPNGFSSQQIAVVRTDRPGTVPTPITITGYKGPDTQFVGIDVRPSNGLLYGLSDNRRLYTINPATGVASLVLDSFSVALSGDFGLGFNPTTDVIRLVGDSDSNSRIAPTDAGFTGDFNVQYGPTDTNSGVNPNVTAVAFTNPFMGASATTLFDIDTGTDTLDLQSQNPANSGTLSTLGALGVNVNGVGGYDIARRFNHGFAALQPSSVLPTAGSTLYAVNAAGAPGTAANGSLASVGSLSLGTGRIATGLALINDNILPATPTPPAVTPTVTTTPTETPTTTPTVTPTATPTVTPSGKRTPGLTGTVKPKRDRTAPFTFTVSGKLKRNGVRKAAGCKGKVKVTIRKGAKALAKRTTSVKSSCKYSAKLTLNRKAGVAGKAKVTISFRGNAKLRKKTITRSARYGPV